MAQKHALCGIGVCLIDSFIPSLWNELILFNLTGCMKYMSLIKRDAAWSYCEHFIVFHCSFRTPFIFSFSMTACIHEKLGFWNIKRCTSEHMNRSLWSRAFSINNVTYYHAHRIIQRPQTWSVFWRIKHLDFDVGAWWGATIKCQHIFPD